nr:hypothetical protein [Actinospica acidiphila]
MPSGSSLPSRSRPVAGTSGIHLAKEISVTAKSAAAAARATVYGYPRQGPNRELKKAIEGYWKGRVTADALHATAAQLRRSNRQRLAASRG